MTPLKGAFALSLLICSAFAVAGPGSSATPATPIAKLRAEFETGVLPAAQDLRGIWLGRCFPNSNLESAIMGALLIGNDPSTLGGPLFESPENVNFRVAFGSPNEFDVFRPAEQPLPSGGTAYGPFPARADGNTWRLQVGSWGNWTSVWRVRQSANNAYLIAMQYSVRSERETAIVVSLLKACYFFKKLQ